MEDKRTTVTNRQGKKKSHLPLSSISISGEGGIAGLFVFGGALAIAGFMAVASFASNKDKAKETHDHQPKPKPQQLLLDEHGCKIEEDQDTNKTLTSLIQHSKIQHEEDATWYATHLYFIRSMSFCWTSNKSINQVNNSSAESLILKEKSDELSARSVESPIRFQHQEIVLSDSSHPESAASSNESGVAEEPLFNNPTGQAQKQEEEEESSETDTESEDDDIKDDDEDGDDENDDMMSDDVSEIGEEDNPKARRRSSLDYKKEPLWPAELMQQAKRKLKGDSHVCSDSSDVDDSDYNEDMTVAKQATYNQNLNLFVVPNNHPLTWLFPLLLLVLLLLLILLTRRPQESFYVLNEDNSVVKQI
ncbi:hypothetical protein CR513_57917, partial [Mucuna pruriens]